MCNGNVKFVSAFLLEIVDAFTVVKSTHWPFNAIQQRYNIKMPSDGRQLLFVQNIVYIEYLFSLILIYDWTVSLTFFKVPFRDCVQCSKYPRVKGPWKENSVELTIIWYKCNACKIIWVHAQQDSVRSFRRFFLRLNATAKTLMSRWLPALLRRFII
jgi:hypothetical protein